MPETPTPAASKRERTTQLGLWIVLGITSESFLLGALALLSAWKKVDISPIVPVLGTIGTVMLTAIAAVGGGGMAYNAADTLRASGQPKGAWVKEERDPVIRVEE